MAKKKKLTEAQQDKLFDKAERILEKHYKRILRRKGVNGVEVNYRTKNGKITDEIVICIHVDKKVPLEKLRSNQIIKSIEGIAVDVVESKNDYKQLAKAVPLTVGAGDKIAPKGKESAAGTLGIVCFDKSTNEPRLLTNAHVVFGGENKTDLPTKWEMVKIKGSKSTRIGDAVRKKSFLDSRVDCALITPDDSVNLQLGVPGLLPNPAGILRLRRKHALGKNRVKVVKLGQKSNVTHGRVISISLRFPVPGQATFHKQIGIVPDPDFGEASFSKAGDSGSVVIYKDKIVGLIHGTRNGGKTAVACHMSDVAKILKIKI